MCGAAICVAVAMALPTAASAANIRESLPPITEANGAPLVNPFALTADSGDHLFATEVAEPANVDKFGPTGSYETRTPEPLPWTASGRLFSAAFDAAAGEVFVADARQATIYGLDPADATPTGVELKEVAGEAEWGAASTPLKIAADNSTGPTAGDLYVYSGTSVYRVKADGTPDPFSEGPNPGTAKLTGAETAAGEFGEAEGEGGQGSIAVDGSGDLWLASTQQHTIYEFAPSGHRLRELTAAGDRAFHDVKALAVDPTSGNVLVIDEQGLEEAILELGPTGSLEGEFTEPLAHNLQGLAVDSTGRLYLADVTADRIDVFGPAVPRAIEFDGGSVLEATSTSAVLAAEVNPNGHPTAYYFQWGTSSCDVLPSACADLPAAPVPLGSGETTVKATQHLRGLALATTYHYRLLVEDTSTHELFAGPDRTFTTQGLASFRFPDGRGYEMVSPPVKSGGRIEPISEAGVVEAAASGDAISYLADAPLDAEAAGSAGSGIQTLSRRGPSGWSTAVIAIPHPRSTGLRAGTTPEYRFFAEDLSTAIVQPYGLFNPAISAQATEQTPYLHTLGSCASDCYQPLVSAANSTGAPFGEERLCEEQNGITAHAFTVCGPLFLGATSDLGHAVLASAAPLTENAPRGTVELDATIHGSLYEWSAGHLQLVSVLPPNEAGEELAAAPGATLGAGFGDAGGTARRAISGDGRRVLWNMGGANPTALYMRDTALGKSLQLDAAEPSCPAGECESGGGRFQIASADGTRVFFTDEHRLTESSGAGSEKSDLYECRIVEGAGGPSCHLTDLTPQIGGEAAEIQGNVLGDGESGEDLYFVARGTLGTGSNAGGESAVSGQPNLYVRRGGQTQFVARLSNGDGTDWELPPEQPTRVSPDGRWLEFMSERPLTGYDNRDRVSGRRDAEVFLYDADSGSITCASCDPTGARPVGIEYHQLTTTNASAPLATVSGQWPSDGWVAALVPQTTQFSTISGGSGYQSRYLSNSGRLFFNALGNLLPADSNGVGDVYESEPADVGGCTASDPGFRPASGRCLDLISSGTSPEASSFLDASESGNDVFFLTHSRLSSKDVDNAADVYDASVGGGEAEAAKPVECSGDACQQPAVPPVDATPGSLTFDGAGNVVECPKGKVKQKGKCVKKQQKKAKKHKKKHQKKKQHHKKKSQGKAKHGGSK